MADYIAIATWPFGATAVRTAMPLLEKGAPALDAAITGAQAIEDDTKVQSVGYGGIANAIGTVSLDACVMDGQTLSCGAVAAVENVRHAAALARRVMDKTPHVLLVGEGARLFALTQGFPLQTLDTPESVAEWEKRMAKEKKPPTVKCEGAPRSESSADNHDTVAVLALDKKGNLGGVCTTSGLALKLPGRVGDSPLIGHGLYVDNQAGAAGATGVGEEVIRVCGSKMVVEAMRAGKTPQEACEQVIRDVNHLAVRRGVHPAQVAFIALSPKGEVGAACTARTEFHYAVAQAGEVKLNKAKVIDVEPK